MAARQLSLFDAQIRFRARHTEAVRGRAEPKPRSRNSELVRNAYDADARSCTVELERTDQEGGSIRVIDDGEGMDRDQIEQGWLVLGKSIKSARTLTGLGRVPAGNKGLGRLAALRMGARVTMVTRPHDEPGAQYELPIDWHEYDQVSLIEEVILKIKETSRARTTSQGTEITISDLRQRIGRMDVKRLARAMILLADPFGEDKVQGFEPILRAPEFADLEALVKGRYFSDAEYHLIAQLDKHGRSSASVVDWRGNKLFSAEHGELTSDRQKAPISAPWRASIFGPTCSPRRLFQHVRQRRLEKYANGYRVSAESTFTKTDFALLPTVIRGMTGLI